jgi:hypothetical protein
LEFSDNTSKISTDDVKPPPPPSSQISARGSYCFDVERSLLNNAAIDDMDETRRPRLHELSRHLVDMT